MDRRHRCRDLKKRWSSPLNGRDMRLLPFRIPSTVLLLGDTNGGVWAMRRVCAGVGGPCEALRFVECLSEVCNPIRTRGIHPRRNEHTRSIAP